MIGKGSWPGRHGSLHEGLWFRTSSLVLQVRGCTVAASLALGNCRSWMVAPGGTGHLYHQRELREPVNRPGQRRPAVCDTAKPIFCNLLRPARPRQRRAHHLAVQGECKHGTLTEYTGAPASAAPGLSSAYICDTYQGNTWQRLLQHRLFGPSLGLAKSKGRYQVLIEG